MIEYAVPKSLHLLGEQLIRCIFSTINTQEGALMKTHPTVVVLSCFMLMLTYSSAADAARRKPLQDPPKVTIPCSMGLEEASHAITRGLASHGWGTEKLGSSAVKGIKIHNGKHRLEIIVRFGADFYDVDYGDSLNLNYRVKNGVSQIHPAANEWMTSINTDLSIFMRNQCAVVN